MAQRRLRVALWLFALLLAAAWQVTPAFANTITVNTTTDEFGAGAGCSLREAIKAANDNSTFGGCSAGAGADNIEIPAGTYTITIAGTGEDSNATGDWDIAESATLVGAGQGSTILDGGSLDRVIQAFGITDVTLVLRDLTIQNGLGAINVDTGMSSGTSTTLTRVTVRNNTGSGINSGNDLIVTDSTFVGNSGGSAIVPTRDVSISGSTFSGNSAAEGAVLWADGQGYTITSSTFSGNSATTSGGVFRVGGGSAISLNNVTFADNTAPTGGTIWMAGGGTFTVRNSIVKGTNNCSAAISSSGNNLDSANTCGFAGAGDLINTDPLLGALANNGGTTQTRAPGATSPVLDAGNNATCTATDQRGTSRPQLGRVSNTCDMGAFELVGSIASTSSVAQVSAPGPEVFHPSPPSISAQLPGGEGGYRVQPGQTFRVVWEDAPFAQSLRFGPAGTDDGGVRVPATAPRGTAEFSIPLSADPDARYDVRLFGSGGQVVNLGVIVIDPSAPGLSTVATAAAGSSLNIAWDRVGGADPFAWIALFSTGGRDAVSPALTIGPGRSGSVALPIPPSLASGSYEVRLIANGRTVRTTRPIAVTDGPPATSTGTTAGLITFQAPSGGGGRGAASVRFDPSLNNALPDGTRLRVAIDPAPSGLNQAAAGSIGGGAMTPLSAPIDVRVGGERTDSGAATAVPDAVLNARFEVRLPRPRSSEGEVAWLTEVRRNGTFFGYERRSARFEPRTDEVVLTLTGAELQGTLFLPVVLKPAFVRNLRAAAPMWSSAYPDAVNFWPAAPQFTLMTVLGPQLGGRLLVHNSFTNEVGWIDAEDVGPSRP